MNPDLYWLPAERPATHTLVSGSPVHSLTPCESPWDNDRAPWSKAVRVADNVVVSAPTSYFTPLKSESPRYVAAKLLVQKADIYSAGAATLFETSPYSSDHAIGVLDDAAETLRAAASILLGEDDELRAALGVVAAALSSC